MTWIVILDIMVQPCHIGIGNYQTKPYKEVKRASGSLCHQGNTMNGKKKPHHNPNILTIAISM